jgi:hypothetical protein
MEYAQYEAYRRSTFRGDLVSKFVASCLIQIEQERFAQRANSKDFLSSHGDNSVNVTTRQLQENDKEEELLELRLNLHPIERQRPDRENTGSDVEGDNLQLDPLVEPHTAPDITIAVSSLAKSYAHRLIQASRSISAEQKYDEHAPLLPTHVLEAYRQRSQSGLDPGFFLQPSYYQNSTIVLNGLQRRRNGLIQCYTSNSFVCPESDATLKTNRVMKTMGALASQELYDQLVMSLSPPTVDDVVDASKIQQKDS